MMPCPERDPNTPPDNVGDCDNCGERAQLNIDGLCAQCSEPEPVEPIGRTFFELLNPENI